MALGLHVGRFLQFQCDGTRICSSRNLYFFVHDTLYLYLYFINVGESQAKDFVG
jgi:hypothetical protein